MAGFQLEELKLSGAYLIEGKCFSDNRGVFRKVFEKNIFFSNGITFSESEVFYSNSSKNVIRGLHFQVKSLQAKLISVVSGRAWDVIVDLRVNSATYKQWCAFELNSENARGIYIPRGFAHGFLSLEDNTIMVYQCDGEYNKETDTGIRFDDYEIGVDWPIDIGKAVISERDLQLMSLKEYENRPMKV